MPKKPPSSKPPKREQSTWNASGFNYSGAAWIRLRNLKRQISPLCELCLKRGVLTPFHTIDHIKPILEGGEPYDIENTQTLCNTCHRIKSAKERHRRTKK